MKEVWIVLGHWNYDNTEVIRVCVSEKLAKHTMDNNEAAYDRVFIERHEVEDRPLADDGMGYTLDMEKVNEFIKRPWLLGEKK